MAMSDSSHQNRDLSTAKRDLNLFSQPIVGLRLSLEAPFSWNSQASPTCMAEDQVQLLFAVSHARIIFQTEAFGVYVYFSGIYEPATTTRT